MIYHMISEAWSCLDLLFRHWGSWWFTIVNMYRKDWPGGGKAGGFFTFYHRMWSTYSSVPCKKNRTNLPKSPEAQYLYHSLSLPLHLSLSIYLCVFQKSTARFPAQYNRAVFCCSESFGVNGTLPFSLVCLFDKDDKCWDEGNLSSHIFIHFYYLSDIFTICLIHYLLSIIYFLLSIIYYLIHYLLCLPYIFHMFSINIW